jgi:hypothetical protein
MTTITEAQYESLSDLIYSTIMNIQTYNPETNETIEMGMGEMGDARDEADRIVDEWISKEGLQLITQDHF